MYTCSICNETFLGSYQNSIYSTLCGHVFHFKCLNTWLHRSQTCPNCRSTISQDQLIKLFLQVDNNARVILDQKANQEIVELRDKLKNLKEKDEWNKIQLTHLQSKVEDNNKTIESFKLEYDHNKITIEELEDKLRVLNIGFNILEDKSNCFQKDLISKQKTNKLLENNLCDLQSVNSVVIENLKFEIADLKAEKEYFQNKCHKIEKGNSELQSTSKINDEKISSHVIPIENKFYGHDSNLKLSSKDFLLGCVFYFVKKQNYYENMCDDTAIYKITILEHGGSIEEFYSPRVTHLICMSQKTAVVQQGIDDKKRCVTDYWLMDVIEKKQMLPPWLAHHFPTLYSESALPCKGLKMCINNFDSNEYQRIKVMVEFIGASCVSDVTHSTDFLITLKLEGNLVETALALNKPVVNIQWLSDILLGAKIGLKNPKNIKYQQFDLPNPFLVNYDMVPHLMESWKIPVFVFKNEQVYELTESSDGSTKRKRQKTYDCITEVINLVDDDEDETVAAAATATADNKGVLVTSYISANVDKDQLKKPCVMFCGFSMEEQIIQEQIVLQLGGTIAIHNEGTHLVMKQYFKTLKFLCCISTVDHIVNEQWLMQSQLLSSFQDEEEYCINEIFDRKSTIICNVPQALANSMRSKLFENMIFFITYGLRSISCIDEMIISAGGVVETNIRSLYSVKTLPSNTYFIITCLEDLLSIDSSIMQNYDVYKTDFIINSIMSQSTQEQKKYILPVELP